MTVSSLTALQHVVTVSSLTALQHVVTVSSLTTLQHVVTVSSLTTLQHVVGYPTENGCQECRMDWNFPEGLGQLAFRYELVFIYIV